MNRITGALYRAHNLLTEARDSLLAKTKQARTDERGIENIPVTMILIVGGAIIAVAIIAAITVYVQSHLANIPN